MGDRGNGTMVAHDELNTNKKSLINSEISETLKSITTIYLFITMLFTQQYGF